MLGPKLAGRPDAVVGVVRRHSHVDDGKVGAVTRHGGSQAVGIADRCDHLDLLVAQDPYESLPQEQGVVGDYDAHDHEARMVVPPLAGLVMCNEPLWASRRSRSPSSPPFGCGVAPPGPSSVTRIETLP